MSFSQLSLFFIFVPLWTRTLSAPSKPRRKKKGSAHMPSPRWLAILTIPLMAGAALVTSAAIATADPADGAYLTQLRTLGFTWPADQGHDGAMIQLAHHVCFDRWFVGMPPDRIAQDIHAVMGDQGLSFGDVTAMVNTAESTYCPNG
jgi:hypothetical protein